MISIGQIILIGVLGIIALAIFLLLILFYSRQVKEVPSSKATSQDISDTDIKIWQQERGFWIPRLILALTANSILFLGYIQVRLLLFGGIIAIFAIVLNILYFIFFSAFARTLDSLQKRLEPKLPIEYRKRTLTGRWGFVPLIVVLQSIWVVSALHSLFGWFM